MSGRTDDDALLRRAVAGDGDALETFLLQYFDRLVAVVSRRIPDDVRSALSAEDVVQDAFIVAFQRIGSFEPQGREAFFAWLRQIAENRLMDAAKALRAAKRGGGWARVTGARDADADDVVPVLEMLPTLSRTPSRSVAAHEAIAALEFALEALDPDYREVLRMRYIELLPVAACAARMQRSEGAVHMLLSRALAALRARLGESARYFTRKA
jgi:RNA polymerase sigma-70 factor (ECF subfamily)